MRGVKRRDSGEAKSDMGMNEEVSISVTRREVIGFAPNLGSHLDS